GNQSQVNVKAGATLNLNPHTIGGGEGKSGKHNVAIAANKSGSKNDQVNVEVTLNINLQKTGTAKKMSGGIELVPSSTVKVANGGSLNITQTGKLEGSAAPVNLETGAGITVEDGGNFNINATGLDNSKGALINTKGNVDLQAHSNFKITGDGTGKVAAVHMDGGKFTSDQPQSFNIDLSANPNAVAVENGTVDFTRVKIGENGEPLGKATVTYDNNG
ncbi:hypothetical protein, partial [Bartonella sp. CL63NXGY]|uniref:hypothetical protein n=1 Tax=Bartonella sp. CL63NXGY TaxID=3243538 RepID=UPI0035D06C38